MAEWLNQYVFGVAVPVLLILGGLFYSVRLKFFYLCRPKKLLGALTEREPGSGISSFRALTLALAGTLGVGNIVGVSAAIWLGGAGAVFWMWISALCAMVLKYAEIVLAMRHRRFDAEGNPHGAAMDYIRFFFHSHGLRLAGTLAAGAFALLCILNSLTMGSMLQINAVADAFSGVFGISPVLTGAVLAVLAAVIIAGGTERMTRITEKLVPLMTLGYLLLSAAVLILRHEALLPALRQIFSEAFSPRSATSGIFGFLLSSAVRYGTMRGLISNEAGCGTAPAAHAVSNCRVPARQGVWGIFEVFTDTIVLCTLTALVILCNYDTAKLHGGNFIMMTISSYSATLSDFAAYFMTIAVLFFGFATVICWAHYGCESVAYLTPRPWAKKCFVILFSASVFLGAVCAPDVAWQAADFAVGAMTLINIVVICFLHREVEEETDRYFFPKHRRKEKEELRQKPKRSS